MRNEKRGNDFTEFWSRVHSCVLFCICEVQGFSLGLVTRCSDRCTGTAEVSVQLEKYCYVN